jgi:hypothetical protein
MRVVHVLLLINPMPDFRKARDFMRHSRRVPSRAIAGGSSGLGQSPHPVFQRSQSCEYAQ